MVVGGERREEERCWMEDEERGKIKDGGEMSKK